MMIDVKKKFQPPLPVGPKISVDEYISNICLSYLVKISSNIILQCLIKYPINFEQLEIILRTFIIMQISCTSRFGIEVFEYS